MVCYIKGYARQELLLHRDCNMQLVGFCDSYWGACPDGYHLGRSRPSPSPLTEDPNKLKEAKEFAIQCRKAVTMPEEFIHSSLTPCPVFVTCLQQYVMDQHHEVPYIIKA